MYGRFAVSLRRGADTGVQATQSIRIREIVLHSGLLLVLLGVVFPGTFLRGEMISPGALLYETPPWSEQRTPEIPIVENRLTADALSQFHLWFVLVKDSIADGEWPLWNPTEYGGLPLLANFQSTVFYPPRLLHAVFDVHVATTLYILLKLWMCGMTAYLCGRGLALSAAASRFFSVAWMLGSYNLVWAYWPLPDVAAWVPILFLSAERVLQQRYRQGLFGMAFAATLLLLAGHPETAFTASLGIGAYFLVRLLTQGAPVAVMTKQVAVCAAAWAMALVACSAQLLPFIEYLPRSHTFGHRPGLEAGAFSLPLDHIAGLWAPRFFGLSAQGSFWGWSDWNSNFTGMVFVGVGVWFAAALLLAPGEKKPGVVVLAAVAGVFLLLAFDVPGFNAVKGLPLLSSLWHFYFASFAMFALPLLAAHGLDHWLAKKRSRRELGRPLAFAIGTIVVPTLVFALYRDHLSTLALDANAMTSLAISFFIVIGIALALALFRRSLVYPATAIIVAAELIYATYPLHPTVQRRFLYPDTELTQYLTEPAIPMRVSVNSGGFPAELGAGILPAYGVQQLWGYDGITPNRILGFLNLAEDPGVWERVEPIASVEKYLFRESSEDWSPGAKFEKDLVLNGLGVWKNAAAWPRASLVFALRNYPDEKAVLDAMRASDFDPNAFVPTDSTSIEPFDGSAAESSGRASITHYSNNRVVVAVDSPGQSVLVLSDAYDPGWRATLDGEPILVFPAYHAFRGAVVPEGKHEVIFEYRPRAFQIGLWTSIVGLVLSCLLSLAVLITGRRHA